MLSWLNILAWVINIILYLVDIALWISIPKETTLNTGIGVVALVMTSLLIIFNKEKFRFLYTSQFFRKATSYLITTFFIFVIIGLINYLAFKNPVTFDVSNRKLNTLSSQSKEILKKANGLQVTVFSEASQFRLIDAFLELYRIENKNISIRMVDAEVNPLEVKKYKIEKVPSLNFSYKNRSKNISNITELDITSAIAQVVSEKIPLIYIVNGHQEINFESQENEGASYLYRQIADSNFKLQIVSLSEIKIIPQNVDAVILWGPKSALHTSELKLVDDYLQKGGNLLIALDPSLRGDALVEMRNYLQEKWGLIIDNNFVIDRLKNINGSNGTVPIVAQFEKTHPLTRKFNHALFLPITSSIEISPLHPKSENITILASSMPYPAAWADYSLSELQKMEFKFDEENDRKGPVGYIAAYKDDQNRMIAYGNSTSIINTYRNFPKNNAFFIDALSWLVGRENLLSLDGPVVKDRPIFINQHQIGLIIYISILLLPLTLLTTALIIYLKRRTR